MRVEGREQFLVDERRSREWVGYFKLVHEGGLPTSYFVHVERVGFSPLVMMFSWKDENIERFTRTG